MMGSNNGFKPAKTERAGFEPAMEFDPHTRLAGECLQPLGHLSLDRGPKCRAWSGDGERAQRRPPGVPERARSI
jgi:hypothetical protein